MLAESGPRYASSDASYVPDVMHRSPYTGIAATGRWWFNSKVDGQCGFLFDRKM